MKKQFRSIIFGSLFNVFFGLIPFILNAQVVDTISEQSENLNQKIESIAEDKESEDLDLTEIFEQLEYYVRHPININKATADELKQLNILSDVQISNLLQHIQRFGDFISLYELQVVDGFTPDIIQSIKPFIRITEYEGQRHFDLKEMFKYGENQIFFRYQRIMEEQVGYSDISDSLLAEKPNSRYLGSPEKLYTRYRFNYYKNVSWGITAEKDAGEEFFKGTQQNGYDFYSAHFYLQDFGLIRALSLGDYNLQFGQGLSAWSANAFGKSSEAINIKKNAQRILPSRSVEENNFLRGAAVCIGKKNIDATTFFSYNRIDANMNASDTLNKELETFSSLQETGFHRTPSELEDKNAIDEKIWGAHVGYKNRRFDLGATFINTQFSATLSKDKNKYNQFEFNGDQNTNVGFDYGFSFQNINFFGEFGQSKSGGIAYLNGMLISLHHHFAISLLHRHFDRDYHAFLSNAFSENSRNINEDGIYMGLEYKPSKKIKLTAYTDHFFFPWLKYGVSAPSEGVEYFTQLNYKPSKKVEMYVRFRQEDKQKNGAIENKADYVINNSKHTIRYNIQYQLNENFSFKNRVEWVKYKEDYLNNDYGYMMFHDIKYKQFHKPYTLTFRYALFNTESYNSRIYAYENDVLYSYSIPAYFYKGSRYYIILKYKINRQIDVWLRFAQSILSNQTTIGSGMDVINGNKKSELKFQLRIKI